MSCATGRITDPGMPERDGLSGRAKFISTCTDTEEGYSNYKGKKGECTAVQRHGWENSSWIRWKHGDTWQGKMGQTEKGLKCQAMESAIYSAGTQVPTEGMCRLGQIT